MKMKMKVGAGMDAGMDAGNTIKILNMDTFVHPFSTIQSLLESTFIIR
jgi:hypothetical protein